MALFIVAVIIGSCTPAEHQPFINWVKAIKASDVEAFKSAYSENMRKSLDGKGWQKALEEYKNNFEKEFGDFKVEDFTIRFEAEGKDQGRLVIKLKSEDLPSLNIIKEEGAWRIDEY